MQTRASKRLQDDEPDEESYQATQDANMLKYTSAWDQSNARKRAILNGLVCDEKPNGDHVVYYPGHIKAHVSKDVWDMWHPVSSLYIHNIPNYVLLFLRNNKGADMDVAVNEVGEQTGPLFIIENISTPFKGAFFLVTATGESELAVAVVGFDAHSFAGGRYMLRGDNQQHSQYISQMPPAMMKNWVYSQDTEATVHRPSTKFGDMVHHSRDIGQAATSISCLVSCRTFQVFSHSVGA